jgi:hypothetical protein
MSLWRQGPLQYAKVENEMNMTRVNEQDGWERSVRQSCTWTWTARLFMRIQLYACSSVCSVRSLNNN